MSTNSNHPVVNIDPIFFSVGPLEVRWYGLMYVIGFVLAGVFLRILIKREFIRMPVEKADSLMMTIILSMFLGARLAYVFIYNWGYYSSRPLEILAVWQGGLSFHGAMVGIIVGCYIFARKQKIPLISVMDTAALCATPGIFFGRIGNFINGELYGRVTHSWVGVIFPHGGPYPRHPSQLYEAVLEGLVLSAILWVLLPRFKHYGYLSATFLIGYGFFRYLVEFFREPDSQLGYYFWGTTTMGQILCLLMILAGGIGFYWASKAKVKVN